MHFELRSRSAKVKHTSVKVDSLKLHCHLNNKAKGIIAAVHLRRRREQHGSILTYNCTRQTCSHVCRAKAHSNRQQKWSSFERAYKWLEDHDLERRTIITVIAVLVSRLCFMLPIPGLDRRFLPKILDSGPLGAIKDPFGDLLQTPGNVFQLGFGAMIFSSIVVQVLVSVVPTFKQKTREGGTGEAFIKNMMLYIFIVATVIQGMFTTHLLKPYLIFGSSFDVFTTLVCGSMILRTMCTLIDNFGIGDGFLNILVANIAAEYAVLLNYVVSRYFRGHIVTSQMIGLIVSIICCVLSSIWLTNSVDKLPIKYYSRDEEATEIDELYGTREVYLPFRRNPTGMQPIIIASYLLHLPSQLAVAFGGSVFLNIGSFFSRKVIYFPTYFLLLYGSAFIDINETSREIALYLGKIGALIPGVRPGESTVTFVEQFRRKSIRKGALLLGLMGTLSLLAEIFYRNSIGISVSLTSVLLIVSAFMQCKRQVVAYQQAPKMEAIIKAFSL